MSSQGLQPNAVAGGQAAGLSLTFWIVALSTGLFAGVGGGLLMVLLHAVQHLAWSYSQGPFLDAVKKALTLRRIAVLAAAGLIAGLVRWALDHQPGGHAGEIAETIWFRSAKVPFFNTVIRAVLSIVVVAMGASLGREAAPKQTGAALGSVFSRWCRLSDVERRLVVACGAAAGIAAVYNVPFGGALFALEALLGSFALPLIGPVFAAAMLATWTSWLFLPNAPTYSFPAYGLTSHQIIWALLAGPIIGMASVAYVRLISWSDAAKPQSWVLTFSPFATLTSLGVIAIRYPELLGNGKDLVQECLLGKPGILLLLPLLVLKPLVTAACLASGTPGGLFTPTLTTGALLGGVLGGAWEWIIHGGGPIGPYVFFGAAALYAAAAQAPVSAVVLIIELTHGGLALVLPLALAIVGAMSVARRLESRSIYSGRIHAGRGASNAKPDFRGTAFDHLLSTAYPVISTAAGYTEMLRVLLSNEYRQMYVVDEDGKLVGQIGRDNDVLKPAPLEIPIGTAGDFAKPVSSLPQTASAHEAQRRVGQMGEIPVVTKDGTLIALARAQ